MKKYLLVICILCVSHFVLAQEDAWVYFKDKQNVSQSINNPTSILTQKAIDRKARYNVAIDVKDVPVNQNYITQIKNQPGITVLAKSKWFNAIHVRGALEAITTLNNITFVDKIDFADKQLNNSSTAKISTSISKFNNNKTNTNTTVNFNYGNAQNQIEMFNGHKLHQQGFTGAGLTIAVLDAGFPNVNTMSSFSRLRNSGGLLDGHNFVNPGSNVYTNTLSNHGTLVLSDMAGFVENQFVGTAPDASYYLFITEDDANENPVEESYWVEAVERADSLGVDLINTSLGYKSYAPNFDRYSYTDSDLDGNTAFITKGANIAVQKGMFLVVSAGNSGSSGLGAPADSADVLSVGAVNSTGNYATFSSIGSTFQPTQKPDVVAQGQDSYVITENDVISTANGTSFSAPILAGGVACLWQALPNKTNLELLNIIRASASLFNTPNNQLGYGIPNLETALNSTLANNDLDKDTVDVFIFPNPSNINTKINFTGLNLENLAITISFVNVLGKRVLLFKTNKIQNTIDVSNLSSGVYFVKVETAGFKETLKFLKP